MKWWMGLLAALLAGCSGGEARTPAEWVDTMVGARVPGKGSCVPGPCMPHGSVHPSPDTLWPNPERPKGRAPNSGYEHGRPVTGFSQFHAQGAGGQASYGIFLVTPTCGEEETEEELASPLTLLETRPYLFRGVLEKEGIGVALSATRHGAVYEFAFPEGREGRVAVDAERKIGMRQCGEEVWTRREGNTLEGGGRYGGDWCPGTYGCWFHAEEEKAGRVTTFRIATSFKSIEKARENFAEVRGKSVGEVAAEAKAAWEERLGRARAEGRGAEEARLYYSHLFHAFVQPRDRTGDLAGWAEGEAAWDEQYTLWDTWRTVFPLMALLEPEAVAGSVNTFGTLAERNGKGVPTAFCAGREFWTGQGGDESDNVTADAWVKGVEGIDWRRAYAAVRRNAERRTKGYLERGYVAEGETAGYDNRMRGGSSTLAFAYNDWCAAEVAEGLGETEDAARWRARAGNWTNVWDAGMEDVESGYRGLCRGRRADGGFRVMTPRGWDDTAFYEGACWDYSYMVPGDVEGLVEKMGGKEAFAERLTYAFDHGLVDMGNEPGFLTPWLFDFAGRPDLASERAHALLRRFREEEIIGDDDGGALGALYVFLTAGLFPVAGQDLYALHAPAAERVVFTLPQGGKRFTVRTELPRDGSRYGEAWLNGRKLERPFLRHADLLAGGELVFRDTAGAGEGKETVTFDANGGRCEVSRREYPSGRRYGTFPEARRPWMRCEWFTAAEGGTPVTPDETAGEGERRLCAHWVHEPVRLLQPGRNFGPERAGGKVMNVEAEAEWTADTEEPWIVLETRAGAAGKGKVVYGLAENTGAAREGAIIVRCGEGAARFAVRQAGGG